MAKPAISGLPQNIFVSAAAIQVNGVDQGLISGFKLTLKEDVTDVKTDQTGKAIVNSFYVGNTITAELMFDEITPQKLKTAFPQATLTQNAGVYRLAFGKNIGQDYYSLAQPIDILAMNDDLTLYTHRFHFFKGIFVGDSALEYSPEKKMTAKVKLMLYPDITQPSGQWYGYMGSPTAGTLIPPSDIVTPGGSNVGNGTVGSVSLNDTFTKTENWTLTCISAASGGLWSVSGSISGARGVATTGSAYFSNSIINGNSEIGFTITAGGTAFVIGDSFVIATTAANYT